MGKAARNKAAKQKRRAARKKKAEQQKYEPAIESVPLSPEQQMRHNRAVSEIIRREMAAMGRYVPPVPEAPQHFGVPQAKTELRPRTTPPTQKSPQQRSSMTGLFDQRFKSLPVWSHPDYQQKLLVWEGEISELSNIVKKVSVFLAEDAIPGNPNNVADNPKMIALGETFANVGIFQTHREDLEEFQDLQQWKAHGAFNTFFMGALNEARTVELAERIMWSRVELTLKNGDVMYYDPEGEYWKKSLVSLFEQDFQVLRHNVLMQNR